MRLKVICAVLVGLLLVVAPGCGSKKKSASTTNAATTMAVTTNQTTTSTTSSGGKLTGTDCQKLAAATQTLSSVTRGKVPTDINAQVARLQALAKVAPAAVKGDFQVLAQAGAKLAQLKLKPGQTPTSAQITQLLASLNIPQLTTASQHIAAWAAANCKA